MTNDQIEREPLHVEKMRQALRATAKYVNEGDYIGKHRPMDLRRLLKDYDKQKRQIEGMRDALRAAWNCISELQPTQARVEVAELIQEILGDDG